MNHSEAHQLAEHLFRREAGRIVSTLTRVFGIDRMELAEDVVQEALLKALQQWPYKRIPDNPSAWLMQVAKNRALDILRREQNFREKESAIVAEFDHHSTGEYEELFLENEIHDDQLRMMFACCHPSLSEESQVTLTLKTLCGFSSAEIARAFLTNEETINKRLVRAKQRLRDANVELEIPAGGELLSRLDAVLKAIYLLFNEGYKASHGDDLIRRELSDEAIHLCRVLMEHPAGKSPSASALLALMLLHAARFPARMDDQGNLLLLKMQNRSLWDRRMIVEGITYLDQSADGELITEYHLQAGIAACHCLAPSYEDTDWEKILMLYNMLIQANDSPVVLLNRAIALAKVQGPEAGVKTIEEIRSSKRLDSYYLLYAVLGELYFEMKRYEEAATHFRRALELTSVRSEQDFLSRKLEDVTKFNMN
ncbi:MAG: sigma-70 family RNA polymerase sigma factor [Ignavibacteriae bacterium]|nr:sigma-70 family RNA polymerase sigma factor [Ignavibacteriota bacterium]